MYNVRLRLLLSMLLLSLQQQKLVTLSERLNAGRETAVDCWVSFFLVLLWRPPPPASVAGALLLLFCRPLKACARAFHTRNAGTRRASVWLFGCRRELSRLESLCGATRRKVWRPFRRLEAGAKNLYWVKGRSITTPPLLYNVPCTIFASSSIYTQPNTQRRERVTRVLGLVLHLLAAQVLGGSMRVCRCGNVVTSWFDYVRLIQLLFRSGGGYCSTS